MDELIDYFVICGVVFVIFCRIELRFYIFHCFYMMDMFFYFCQFATIDPILRFRQRNEWL